MESFTGVRSQWPYDESSTRRAHAEETGRKGSCFCPVRPYLSRRCRRRDSSTLPPSAAGVGERPVKANQASPLHAVHAFPQNPRYYVRVPTARRSRARNASCQVRLHGSMAGVQGDFRLFKPHHALITRCHRERGKQNRRNGRSRA